MIKKAKFICLFAVVGLLCADFAMADSVVVNGDVLYYTSDGFLNIDLVPGGSLPSSCSVDTTFPQSTPVSGATADSDIVVSGPNAFVRTGNIVTSVPIAPVCLAADNSHSVGECIAEANLDAGTLTIPCVYYQGNIYEVRLKEQGSSSNWDVTSTGINGGFLDYPGKNR
ncbi:MAG: hypothetical protein ACU88J_08070 [Gammaproteobacteria bacterium]